MPTSTFEWSRWDHQFLRFRWQGSSYQFRILLFGLSSAPRVFTKTLAPLIVWLRLLGFQLYTYLDDLLIMGEAEVAQSVQKTIQVIIQAGFVVNLKSELAPTQDFVYIGAMFHTDLGRLHLLEIQIQALTACVRSSSKQTSSPIPEFAGADGSNAAVSGIRSPLHASHPAVPEVVLDPQVASSDLCQQRSDPRAPLVGR